MRGDDCGIPLVFDENVGKNCAELWLAPGQGDLIKIEG